MTNSDVPALVKRVPRTHMAGGLILWGEIYLEFPGAADATEAEVNLFGGKKPETTPPRKAQPDTDVERMFRVLKGLERMATDPRVVDSYVVRNEVRS